MSGSINKVILIGNLGKDPEIRFMPDGSKIASFPVATNEFWKDKTSGERKDKTEWHKVVVFNEKLIEICEKYLKKGSNLYLEGQLKTRKWTDQKGQEHYTTEIVMSKYKGEITLLNSNYHSEPKPEEKSLGKISQGHLSNPILNDDVPF